MIRPRIADVVTIASRLSGVPEREIKDPCKQLHLCAVRYAIYLTARDWGYSFPTIGRGVGGRDHSTIINSLTNHRRFAMYVEDFDDFCTELARQADELPPFVADSNWQPERIFNTTLTAHAQYKRRRASLASLPANPRKPTPDYDMIYTAKANAATTRGSAQLMAALARAA